MDERNVPMQIYTEQSMFSNGGCLTEGRQHLQLQEIDALTHSFLGIAHKCCQTGIFAWIYLHTKIANAKHQPASKSLQSKEF